MNSSSGHSFPFRKSLPIFSGSLIFLALTSNSTERLRSLNSATESTSPTTRSPGPASPREFSSNYRASPSTASHASNSRPYDMGPPSGAAQSFDSSRHARDRDDFTALNRNVTEPSATSSSRVDSRTSSASNQGGPSGGNLTPLKEFNAVSPLSARPLSLFLSST